MPLSGQRFGFIDQAFVDQLVRNCPDSILVLKEQARNACSHRFNLLGSGWLTPAHGLSCEGVLGRSYGPGFKVHPDRDGGWLERHINRANLSAAQNVWKCVDVDYQPIDWQLDFKSGYRWSEAVWHQDIKIGELPGVDIKVPWELARMQHLPVLALSNRLNESAENFVPDLSSKCVREFRNQVLDFIATNPPGFGVNWVCAMDVAIRASNIIVAHDILTSTGVRFDASFEAVLHTSLLAHGRHIVQNLEWNPHIRGNHYLADIAGLLFIANYLPCGDEVDVWLRFAVQELMTEVSFQFNEDGGNFEASVCYHRLSAEMVLWSFALLSSLSGAKRHALLRTDLGCSHGLRRLQSKPIQFYPIPGQESTSPIPEWCWHRLARMRAFTAAMTKPDGLVAQFGDNDSGRFISVGGSEQLHAGNQPSAAAWTLDHCALVGGIDALFACLPALDSSCENISTRLIHGLAQVVVSQPDDQIGILHDHDSVSAWKKISGWLRNHSREQCWRRVFPLSPVDKQGELSHFSFPDSGFYVFKSRELFLAIRCGSIGLGGLGAHAHCDQLAIELVLNGNVLIRDPGTFLYTPFPDVRNAYRSVGAHDAPRVAGAEPADLTRGVFDLRGAAEGECLYFGPLGFIGRHKGYGAWIYRLISFSDNQLEIVDFYEGSRQIVDPSSVAVRFSPGYGVQE
jgi:hypothetical protein